MTCDDHKRKPSKKTGIFKRIPWVTEGEGVELRESPKTTGELDIKQKLKRRFRRRGTGGQSAASKQRGEQGGGGIAAQMGESVFEELGEKVRTIAGGPTSTARSELTEA